MAISFSTLDLRLSRDIRAIHDFLWDPGWKGNQEALRKNVLKEAKELDTFIRARGLLGRNVERLAKPWDREHQGSSLFELLHDTLGLTAATENVRKGKYRDAALRAQDVVDSTSIGICSAADRFEIVEEWESRKVDFETYTSKIADALQSRFVLQPGQFKRLLNTVHDFGADWDGSAPKTEQTLAARAAVEDAAWCVSRGLAIRTMLGRPQKVSEKDFGAILALVVARL